MTKQEISEFKFTIPMGFLYWINEHHDLRGLRNIQITEYPSILATLLKEYDNKYPNGLTGWKE